MISIKFIRENIDLIKQSLASRNSDVNLDSILNKANTTKARHVLILNDSSNNQDEKVILTTLTIKKLSPSIRTEDDLPINCSHKI